VQDIFFDFFKELCSQVGNKPKRPNWQPKLLPNLAGKSSEHCPDRRLTANAAANYILS